VFKRKTAAHAVYGECAPPSERKPIIADLKQLLNTGHGALDEVVSKRMLQAYGIPTVDEKIVETPESCMETAEAFGYPLVMKGIVPGKVHKTEHGLVHLGITDREMAMRIYEEMTERMKGQGQVLLQRQLHGKVELILGMVRDTQFGPCVMIGLGGIMAEVFQDTAFAMAPLSHDEAVDLINEAFRTGLVVEGLSFHVGSQCANFDNFVQALNIAAAVMREARSRGHEIKILDIGGGFPVAYDAHVKPLAALARKINAEIGRLFAKDIEILAEPGRYLVATAATAVARVIGRAVRDGKMCYYIDDSVYHTYSGIVFDHCQYNVKAFKRGETEICTVFGQTCDGMDAITQSQELPKLEIDDLVYSENIGAYSNASATWFNGFAPAQVVHVNE